MPLPVWVPALKNRGRLYERLVLDTLPRGARAVARGARGAPFDLVVREPGGTFVWEVKGNELDARGPILERRRFSASAPQVDFARRHGDCLRLCLLWLDPARERFGWRVFPAEGLRWKSPASPKWVLPVYEDLPRRRSLARYASAEAGARLGAAWDALPEVGVEEALALTRAPGPGGGSGSRGARTRATATPSAR